MRLLYLCSDLGIDPSGTKGASVHLRSITQAIAEAGHEVSLLSPRGGTGPEHPAKSVLEQDSAPAARIARELKRWLTDRDLPAGVARELRALLFSSRAPEQVVSALGVDVPDVILERLSLFGHVGLDLAAAWDRPLVVEVNAILTDEARAYRSLELQHLAATIERRVLTSADAVVAVSEPLAKRVVELGAAPKRTHVVANGAHPVRTDGAAGRDAMRRYWGIGDAFTVGFVGSLKAWHGVDVLLRAFHGLVASGQSAARLVIVGEGPTRNDLQRLARDLGIERSVVFTGAVPHAQVADCLQAMDVAVAPFLPSDDFYFSPIKLFEYMAAGVCVIASDMGQIREVVKDGVNGLLCRAGDVDDLRAVLGRARDSDTLRRSLAANALREFEAQHTWDHVASRVLCVLNDSIRIRSERRDRVSDVHEGERAAVSENAA